MNLPRKLRAMIENKVRQREWFLKQTPFVVRICPVSVI